MATVGHGAMAVHRARDVDWDKTYATVRSIMLDKFADRAQPLVAADALRDGRGGAGGAPRDRRDAAVLPNKHHFLVDLGKWGLDNPNEVFYAADRPYGLIEASIIRDDLPPAPEAWLGVKGFI